MATTTAKLFERTLRRLGVLGRGQTAQAEDLSDMQQAYNEVYAWLDRHSLVSWDDTDTSIPDEFVNDFVALMAKSRLDDYGVNQERRAEIREDARVALGSIAKIQAAPKTGETEIEDF